MNKIILLLIAVFAVTEVNGQPGRRWAFATTVGTAVPMNAPASTPFTWQILGYYKINKRVAIGAGTGLSFYEKTLIPLFADAKFALTRPRKITPYLECGAGYGFAPGKHANGGFYLNPSIGVQYSICGDKQLLLAVGYEQQKLERLKRQDQLLFATEFAEKLNHNSISVKIGFMF